MVKVWKWWVFLLKTSIFFLYYWAFFFNKRHISYCSLYQIPVKNSHLQITPNSFLEKHCSKIWYSMLVCFQNFPESFGFYLCFFVSFSLPECWVNLSWHVGLFFAPHCACRSDEKLELQWTLEGHQLGVVSVDISHNGAIAASSSLDAHIRLWDLESGKQIKSMDAGPGKCGPEGKSDILYEYLFVLGYHFHIKIPYNIWLTPIDIMPVSECLCGISKEIDLNETRGFTSRPHGLVLLTVAHKDGVFLCYVLPETPHP